MRYSSIKQFDMANGEGIRTSLFVTGCNFHCKDCFNPEAQDFEYGKPYTEETEAQILEMVANPHVKGLSILGGDPLWQDNDGLWDLAILAHKVKQMDKTVWIWSGFKWENIFPKVVPDWINDLQWYRQNLIEECDVFVDGQFEADKKDLSLKWRGSSNQRVIDVQKSLEANEVVLYET